MWSVILAVLCGAGIVLAAPFDLGEPRSSDLPVEHRQQEKKDDLPNLFEMVFDEVMKLETVGLVDEATSRVVDSVGGLLDGVTDFVVANVRGLPSAIGSITERIDKPSHNVFDRVGIVMQGLGEVVANATKTKIDIGTRVVDRVSAAAEESHTADSLKELDKTLRLATVRISNIFLNTYDDVDSAVADAIRTLTDFSKSSTTEKPSIDLRDKPSNILPERDNSENEVRIISKK